MLQLHILHDIPNYVRYHLFLEGCLYEGGSLIQNTAKEITFNTMAPRQGRSFLNEFVNQFYLSYYLLKVFSLGYWHTPSMVTIPELHSEHKCAI